MSPKLILEVHFSDTHLRVCSLDDQQLQDVIQGQQSSDQEYLVKVFANGMSIAVEVKDPHVFIAKLIKQVRR